MPPSLPEKAPEGQATAYLAPNPGPRKARKTLSDASVTSTTNDTEFVGTLSRPLRASTASTAVSTLSTIASSSTSNRNSGHLYQIELNKGIERANSPAPASIASTVEFHDGNSVFDTHHDREVPKGKKNPMRQWHGGLHVPSPRDIEEDDNEEDYGAHTAAPVRPLPPVDSLVHSAEDTVDFQTERIKPVENKETETARVLTFNTTQFTPKTRQRVDESLHRHARRKILFQKHMMQTTLLAINGTLIFATWWWQRYYYILLPLITATVALNIVMIFSIIIRRTWNAIYPDNIIIPKEPESMILLIPCYNETKEELIKSLDSLIAQRQIEDHKHAIMIVCDGKARGPGMAKTTADYLLQDILTHKSERKYIPRAYTAWDQQPMDLVVQRGKYQGLPYYCIVKQQNSGKRDGLIIARSFLYNFNRRSEAPKTIFSSRFFDDLATFMINDAQIENVVHLIGMDADTFFDENCVYELLRQSRYPKTKGVCGYVAVDWQDSHWSLWRLYQSAEYTVAQGLRRLHQSLVTHKVSCLPGCCQLLRICDETCGDHVLLDLFGFCPELTDNLLKQIRATASEDRNHVCHMLTACPQSQTRQALRAKAYTDVPRSWSVFLSQRRRWSLGATSNDLLLVFSLGVQWFERIVALVNVWTWFLNPFIFASIAGFIRAITIVEPWIILIFVGVMLIPISYCFAIPLWLCKKWRERVQFWAGLSLYIFCGPFINIFVLIYALIYMDSFGWGKTRTIIAEDSTAGTEGELARLENGEAASESEGRTRTEATSEHSEKASVIKVAASTEESRNIGDEERNVGN